MKDDPNFKQYKKKSDTKDESPFSEVPTTTRVLQNLDTTQIVTNFGGIVDGSHRIKGNYR
jgi:hypothetical protein